MRDFIQLVKAIEASSLTIGKKKNSGKIVKPHTFSLNMLLIGLVMAISLGSQAFSVLSKTTMYNIPYAEYKNVLTLMLSLYSLYGLFMSLAFASVIFFKGNNDIFLSLPISGNKFFLAKLVLMAFINFVYGGFAILAVGVMICIMLKLSFLAYISVVLFFLFYSIIAPCIVFIIVDLLANFIDFKSGKIATVVFSVLSGILASASMFIISFMSSSIPLEATAETAIQGLNNYCSHFGFLSWIGYLPCKAILLVNGVDFLYIFAYLGIGFLFVALSLLLSRRTYLAHLGKTFTHRKRQHTREEIENKILDNALKIKHLHKVNLKREFSNYRKERTVLINSFILPITMFISLAITLYSFRVTGVFTSYPVVSLMFADCASFTSLFFVTIPYVALSLEKRELLLLKTIPLKYKELTFSKILPSLVFQLPLAVIMTIVYVFAAPIDVLNIVTVLVLAILYSLAIIALSFFYGVTFPNFNYSTGVELTKRGLGVTLSYISHIVLVAIVCIIHIVTFNLTLSFWLSLIINGTILLAIAVVFYILSIKQLTKFFHSEISF